MAIFPRVFTVCAAAALLSSMAGNASAQVVVPAGHMVMGGIPVVCEGYPTVLTPMIPDVAMFNGQAILVNTSAGPYLPPVAQVFLYAHECGHAHVGMSEIKADQWGILLGKSQGLFRREDIDTVGSYLSPVGDATHPPAAERVLIMKAAYDLGRFVTLEEARRHEQSDDDAGNESYRRAPSTKWQYKYSRLDSDVMLKSRKFSSEEACDASQKKRDESPDYVAQDCEEVDE